MPTEQKKLWMFMVIKRIKTKILEIFKSSRKPPTVKIFIVPPLLCIIKTLF
ncbi:hypothetical protein FACS189418_1920 [Clostridia bacterium]|nr:hypothetical protein FACS189418_1920 [Clostridia bacterium]